MSTRRVAVLVMLGMCGGSLISVRPAAAARRSPLPDYGRLPEFSLVDQDRRPLSRSMLEGSVWIADFIFTRCAGQCPLMSAQMATLQARVEPPIRLLSMTVDPLHDTPEALAAYARHYGAEAGRWSFLTGNPEAIRALARDGFHLAISDEGTPEEPVTHSVRFALVDQTGHVRGSYEATDAQAMARLITDARALLHEGPELAAARDRPGQ